MNSDDEPTVAEAVRRLQVMQTRAAATAARLAGVNLTSWNILSELAVSGELTSGQITSRLAMSTGGMTAALDRLEAAELADRHPHPSDRRSSLIAITPRGVTVLGLVDGKVRAGLDEGHGLPAGARPESCARLVEYLADVYAAVQADMARRR